MNKICNEGHAGLNVHVYGFGSHFAGTKFPADIDLLLIHEMKTSDSIDFAIKCKKELQVRIPALDLTILSSAEEAATSFLSVSNALFLHTIQSEFFSQGVEQVMRSIQSRQSAR